MAENENNLNHVPANQSVSLGDGWIRTPVESWRCGRLTHVFACDHTATCQCGQLTRSLPPCPVCGTVNAEVAK